MADDLEHKSSDGSSSRPTIDWSSSLCKNQLTDYCNSIGSDSSKLRRIFYDICDRAINGSIPRLEYITTALRDIFISIPHAITIFVDVLTLFDVWSANDSTAKNDNKRRSRFIAFISACNDTCLSDVILKERLDYETTGDAKIIPNKKAAQTKFVKLKTRLYYKQQKFNLLREESEGYAKLITELNQVDDFEVSSMNQVIRSLIGCFNLDPNRVLDVMLESFESRLHLEKSYVPLIAKFLDNETTLTQVVALKFNFYKTKRTPESLYLLAAVLISNELIDLTELLCYLGPKDSLIESHNNYLLEEARKIIRKATVISTVEDQKEDDPFKEEERFSLFVNNQKLGLCHALTKVGNWKHSRLMIQHLMPPDYCLGVGAICSNLALSLAVSIDYLYSKFSSLPEALAVKIPKAEYPHIRFIKPVECVKEFIEQTVPMVCLIGPYLYINTQVMTKLIRICRCLWPSRDSSSNVDASHAHAAAAAGAASNTPVLDEANVNQVTLRSAILDILDQCILPAVTVIDSNAALSEELWLLLKLIPYESRYRLYYGWKKEPTVPLLMKVRASSLSKMKYIMKRLSKDTYKQYGRQIGKLSHSNPVFLFQNVLAQIQSYDNLIGPVVDSLKYLTPLSYDVLIYCIIEVLADSTKGRTQADGASISPWILSLANFCGCVVKKYSCELPGLLQFIANQLKSEKSHDLFVLKEIVSKMAGIEPTEQMTTDQLAALSGGSMLRQEGGYFNQVRNTRKSSIRLKNALIEHNLAIPLCMLMAQQRNCIIYRDQEYSHLKLVGKLYDQCQETLVQFGSFLSNCLSIDDYSGRIPPLDQLLTSYNLNPDVAFFLVRPMIAHRICVKYEELKKTCTGSDLSKLYPQAWNSVTSPLVDCIVSSSNQLAGKSWDQLPPRLFVTFWILSMYDLEVPKNAYDKETEKLKLEIQQLEEISNVTLIKKKKEIEKSRMLLEKLLEEQLLQDQHVSRVRATLDLEKDEWFKSRLLRTEMTTQFFQYCVFPRCIFSALDALFCAKFIILLHTLKTPNFSTLVAIDRIFADITFTMCSCTENEANNYGRFLAAILDIITRWHMNEDIFTKECATFPGFVAKFSESDPCHVEYKDYRHVCHKWHYRITKAVILCFDSGEYLQIRNSLLILTKILNYFPVVSNFAQAIDRHIEEIRAKEKDNRKDLYALATGYIGQLKARKPYFMPESAFHETTKPIPTSSSSSNSGKNSSVVQNSSSSSSSNTSGNQSSSSSSSQVQSTSSSSTANSSNSSSSQQTHKQQSNNNNNPSSSQVSQSAQQKQSKSQQSLQQQQQPPQIQQSKQQQKQKSPSPAVVTNSSSRSAHQSPRSQSPASACINGNNKSGANVVKNSSTDSTSVSSSSSKNKRSSSSTPDNSDYHSSSSKKRISSSQDPSSGLINSNTSNSSSSSSNSKKRSNNITPNGHHSGNSTSNHSSTLDNHNPSNNSYSSSSSDKGVKGAELFALLGAPTGKISSSTPSSVVTSVSSNPQSSSSNGSSSKKRQSDSSSRSLDSPDRIASRSKKSKIDNNQSTSYSSHSSSSMTSLPPPLPPHMQQQAYHSQHSHSSSSSSHHRVSSSSSQSRYSSSGSSSRGYHR